MTEHIIIKATCGIAGACLLLVGLVAWAKVAEQLALASGSFVGGMFVIGLWLAATSAGAALYRMGLAPHAPAQDDRRLATSTFRFSRMLRAVCRVALVVSVVAAAVLAIGARWIEVHHSTNGWYGLTLLPVLAALFIACMTFYFTGWTAFAANRRFDVQLLLVPLLGLALITAVLAALHP